MTNVYIEITKTEQEQIENFKDSGILLSKKIVNEKEFSKSTIGELRVIKRDNGEGLFEIELTIFSEEYDRINEVTKLTYKVRKEILMTVLLGEHIIMEAAERHIVSVKIETSKAIS